MDSINYLSDLSVLVVEDEKDARKFLKQVLFNKFKEIRDVGDGDEGLALYKEKKFDIVISDIRMPKFDGVSLAKEILKINPKQSMVIISAFSDSDAIIELLNIGIEKFILKPINPIKLLEHLKDTGKNIYNEKLIKDQQSQLEQINKKLSDKNRNLEKVIRIFETKIKQGNLIKSSISACKPIEIINKINKVKKEELKHINIKESILDDHIQELIELEEDIEAVTSTMFLKEKFSEKELNKTIACFDRYGQILRNYPIFSKLGDVILTLTHQLSENREPDEKIQRNVLEYLESLVFTLMKWRKEVFEEDIENPNKYDNSISCDVDTIILTLENKLDDIESDIEFF